MISPPFFSTPKVNMLAMALLDKLAVMLFVHEHMGP